MSTEELVHELKRKSFHICSIAIPIIYTFTPRLWMSLLMMVICFLTIYIDVSRNYNAKIQDIVDHFLKRFMRPVEYSGNFKLSGASYMMAGLFFTILLFSKPTAIAASLVLIIGDSSAAIIGKIIGQKNQFGKSLEGSATFFVLSILVTLFVLTIYSEKISFFAIISASLITSLAEHFSKYFDIDDNIVVPILFALALWLSSLMF